MTTETPNRNCPSTGFTALVLAMVIAIIGMITVENSAQGQLKIESALSKDTALIENAPCVSDIDAHVVFDSGLDVPVTQGGVVSELHSIGNGADVPAAQPAGCEPRAE